MEIPRFENVFAGAGRAAAGDREADPVVDPYTGAVAAEVEVATAGDVEAALAAATAARGPLAARPAYRRRDALRAAAAAIAARRDELAAMITRQMAKPIRFARGEVDRAVSTFSEAAEEATRITGEIRPLDVTAAGAGRRALIERVPQGVVFGIAPFNFPLNLVAHKVAPAIAAGCPVILKPSPRAPGPALVLAEILAATDLPPGAAQVLHMPPARAEALATDPRVAHVSFTGSGAVGWRLKGRCVRQRVTLELGGNAAAIVHEDADLGLVRERVPFGAFAAAGQVCIKLQRLFVHAAVYDEVLADLVLAAEGAAGPDPRDDASLFGPLVDDAAADRVMAWVAEAVDAGATVRAGGRRAGRVVYPTVLTGAGPGMKVYDQEVFGPVVVVEPYADFDAALAKVNDGAFGLQAGVFTRDHRRAMRAFRDLEVGGVIHNDVPTFRVDTMPYGGVKASGLGREGLKEAIEAFTEARVMVLRDPV